MKMIKKSGQVIKNNFKDKFHALCFAGIILYDDNNSIFLKYDNDDFYYTYKDSVEWYKIRMNTVNLNFFLNLDCDCYFEYDVVNIDGEYYFEYGEIMNINSINEFENIKSFVKSNIVELSSELLSLKAQDLTPTPSINELRGLLVKSKFDIRVFESLIITEALTFTAKYF